MACLHQKEINESAVNILENLRKSQKTLSVAESCSGGLLGSSLTNVPGSSKVFKGGIITYVDELKINYLNVSQNILTKYGAVSSKCALAMALGITEKMKTEYGISITGYADSNNIGKDARGMIYIGYCENDLLSSRNQCKVKKFLIDGSRMEIKTIAVLKALIYFRKMILKD